MYTLSRFSLERWLPLFKIAVNDINMRPTDTEGFFHILDTGMVNATLW